MKSAGHAMKRSLKMLLRVVTSFLHHSELPKFSKSSLVEFRIEVSGLICITSASQKECVSWNARIWTLISSSKFSGDTICLEAKFWMSFKTWTDFMWSTNRQRCMFDDTLWLSQARKMTGKWKGGQKHKKKIDKEIMSQFSHMDWNHEGREI